MIDRAVQRGGGQNLASHFMKEWDNEQITIAEIRGAVAQDLHGAFKEWWLASKATNAEQYLFTVAVNPDPKQAEWTREQYHEFIERMEKTLGLEDQPRAVCHLFDSHL
jgi:glucokinase